VDLHPAVATSSEAFGTFGGQQVGYANVNGVYHAALWSGTAASWVDLHPPGVTPTSYAFAISDGQQVGTVGDYAALWTGTAASEVGLHPEGASQSGAYGVSAGQQVGYTADAQGGRHAALWSGTAASWVDLHAVLPSQFPLQFSNSTAQAIWHDAGFTYVVGYGFNSVFGRDEALMWVTSTCYPNCDGSTLAPILNSNDFQCFLNKFAMGDLYANCDGSTTSPILNVNDFQCFLNKFAAGCS
jgi:hypothetical protein